MDIMKIFSIVLSAVLSVAIGWLLYTVSYEQLGFYTAVFYALLAVSFIWASHFIWRWMYRTGYRRGYQQGIKAVQGDEVEEEEE